MKSSFAMKFIAAQVDPRQTNFLTTNFETFQIVTNAMLSD
jgi:hypothetical protein